MDLPAGAYRFTATSDDGIRVYVDGQLIIDRWRVQSAQTTTVDHTLQAGHHQVIVEYFEQTGLALARVSWAPVDAQTALLRVPFGEERETFVMRFDPRTGLLQMLESMRYKEADDAGKQLWINEAQEWASLDGQQTVVVGAVTWFDEGRPWAVFRVEEIVLNADVSEYIRDRGL